MASKDMYAPVAANYAQFRPTYPDDLFASLYAHCGEPKNLAWDVATGSGQAAVKLAESFTRVVATDISAGQIEHAVHRPNIIYSVTAANMTPEEAHSIVGLPGSVDLITIAQAYHWFDQEHFPRVARAVLRPGGVVAAWCYSLCRISPEVDSVMAKWYEKTFPYWEPQRAFIDSNYANIPFHFDTLPGMDGTGPFEFKSVQDWSLHHFLGYLSSWSPLPKARMEGVELLDDSVKAKFKEAWGNPDDVKPVWFPVYLRIGTVTNSAP